MEQVHAGLAREFDRVRQASFAGLFGGAPAQPRVIGRFRLLRRLGQGGMGVVHAAHDPQLDREVALKVLRTTRLDIGDPSRLRRRWLREARALAKVTHPNVVHAYEVGTADDDAYLAMELVEGRTLRDFTVPHGILRARVIDAYVQAARGLAAAHAVGLVHRDFKPDNVLLAADGSAKVVDFGLARASGDGIPTETQVDVDDGDEVTRTGTILGTPAYMAPEQRRGEAVDARADQYAWCVSLHEALTGQRPTSALDDAGRDPVLRVLRRGLAEDPEERFGSMLALVDALQATRRPPQRRWWAAGAIGVLALGVWSLAPRSEAPSEPACGRALALHEAAWNDDREARLAEHLRDVVPELADRAVPHVHATFDAHERQWLQLHADTCRPLPLDGPRHETLRCLDSRARLADAIVSALEAAPASQLTHLDRVLELPSVQDCAQPNRLHQRMPLPEDETRARRVQALRLAITQADLTRRLGDTARAHTALNRLGPSVAEVAFEPLQAELHDALSEMSIQSGDYPRGRSEAQATITVAKRAGVPLLEARGWIKLAMVDGYVERNTDDGHGHLDLAAAAVEQGGGDEKLEVLIEAYRGHVNLGGGRLDEALADYRKALAHERERAAATGTESSLEGQILDTIGTVLRRQGKLEQAEAQMKQAHALLLERVGPHHPKTGAALMALGNVALQRKDAEAAIDFYERANEALGDAPSEIRPRLLNNLGQAYQEADRTADAEKTLRSAVAMLEAQDNQTIERARALSSLSRLLRTTDRPEEALTLVESAVTLGERLLGPEHPELSRILLNRALTHEAAGNPEQADRDALRVIALTEGGEAHRTNAHDSALRLRKRVANGDSADG
ncbi:MAG: serine/threonine-protein kinase [Myxococcota bacterium]